MGIRIASIEYLDVDQFLGLSRATDHSYGLVSFYRLPISRVAGAKRWIGRLVFA